MMAGFRREANENCVLLGYYAARIPKSLNLSPLTMVPIGCPETSVRNDNYSLRNNPEQRSSHLQSFTLPSARQVSIHTQKLHCIMAHKYNNTWAR